MTTSVVVRLPGEELNRRLEELSLRIERMSLLIEDALVDPADTISLERSQYNDLILCLSKYEELLNSFRETTEDTAEEVRNIVGREECFCGETDCDEEIDVLEEDEDTCR
jgi:hypothetical protein